MYSVSKTKWMVGGFYTGKMDTVFPVPSLKSHNSVFVCVWHLPSQCPSTGAQGGTLGIPTMESHVQVEAVAESWPWGYLTKQREGQHRDNTELMELWNAELPLHSAQAAKLIDSFCQLPERAHLSLSHGLRGFGQRSSESSNRIYTNYDFTTRQF